jgi:hypothetical protein
MTDRPLRDKQFISGTVFLASFSVQDRRLRLSSCLRRSRYVRPKRNVAAYFEERREPLQAEPDAQEDHGGDGHKDYLAVENQRQNSGLWKEHQVSA